MLYAKEHYFAEQEMKDEYADKIKQVDYYEKPECISADGLNLMDDVGGSTDM